MSLCIGLAGGSNTPYNSSADITPPTLYNSTQSNQQIRTNKQFLLVRESTKLNSVMSTGWYQHYIGTKLFFLTQPMVQIEHSWLPMYKRGWVGREDSAWQISHSWFHLGEWVSRTSGVLKIRTCILGFKTPECFAGQEVGNSTSFKRLFLVISAKPKFVIG